MAVTLGLSSQGEGIREPGSWWDKLDQGEEEQQENWEKT
jgi:hypothetical protein